MAKKLAANGRNHIRPEKGEEKMGAHFLNAQMVSKKKISS